MHPSEQPAARKKLTPVMRQYEDAKALHPDAILFFRMGDFYEMFNDDAVLVSRALNLTLTARNKGDPDEVPMAGVPHHAAHGYIARLLALGHKVAICEQCGDPSKIKGLVPRQVVRVVTPGLVTDAEQLDARANHYLAAVDGGGVPRGDAGAAGGPYGLALLDLSTGELSAASIADAATLLAELARADPREALIARDLPDVRAAAASLACRAALREDEELDSAAIASILDDAALEPISAAALAEHPLPAARAAARALRFARRCSPGARIPVRRVAPHDTSGTLRIDETAQAHLELARAADGGRRGTLLDVIDCTVTPGGARLLRRRLLAPLADVAAIRRRLDEVELFVAHPRARGELRQALGGVGDLERLSVRALLGEATPRDLGCLRDGLAAAPVAVAAVRSIPDLAAADGPRGAAAPPGSEPLLADAAATDVVADVCAELTAALVERPPPNAREGGVFREGFDKELDEARAVEKNGTELILALEAKLRAQTGAPSLRVKYTRVFGWYIEVTRAHVGKVPDTFRRKQTVATGERYTNDELDDLADKIEHAGARARARDGALRAAARPGGEGRGPPPRARPEARRVGRRRRARRRRAPQRLRAAARHRGRGDRDPRRPPPGGRALRGRGALRAERHPPRPLGRAALADHRPQHGGQVDPDAPGRADRGPRADGQLRPGARGGDRPHRPHPLARGRERQRRARREHVHGRDARDGGDPARRHAALARDPRRDRPRHEHLRRPRDRLGRGRAPLRGGRLPRPVRDALPRAHGALVPRPGHRELLGRRARARRRRDLPPQARGGPGEPQLRRGGRAARGRPRERARPGARDPRDARVGRRAAGRQTRVPPRQEPRRRRAARPVRPGAAGGAAGAGGRHRDAPRRGRRPARAARRAAARGEAQGAARRRRPVAGRLAGGGRSPRPRRLSRAPRSPGARSRPRTRSSRTSRTP
ncbi:uncharacterized protein SOCE26_036070 [Sorangium cellulosum]|uniref:DNA mismatch repair protein MutS n=1 Tax=Sorangium cellulosum TaxID=56 RepID=A0A2L0ESD4_SORCE|nr:uncharacterized protein SOCE26_036070 [Sorangium cellulosum]